MGRAGAHGGIGLRALLVAALVSGAAAALAQPRPKVRLAYVRDEGAEHCPDATTVRAGVTARLGWDPFDDGAPRTLSAQISRQGRTLRAMVKLTDETGAVAGTRELGSTENDCAELAAAMALAISMAIDPQAALRAPPVTTAPVAAEGSGPPSPPAASASAAPTPATPSAAPGANLRPGPGPLRRDARLVPAPPGWVGRATGGLSLTMGTAPGAALGMSAGVAAQRGALSIGLEGRVDLPAARSVPSGGGRVTATIYRAVFAPCLELGPAQACALASLGALHGTGEDVRSARSETTLLALAGGRAALGARALPPFWVGAHADLEVVATPTELKVGQTPVYETSPVAVTLGGWVGIEIP